MELSQIERWIGWLGGLAALVTLGAIFLGLWHGMRRAPGGTVGSVPGLLKSPVFYGLSSAAYFGFCYFLWKPLPFALSDGGRLLALFASALVYFAGLGLVLWGRLALGKQYFVSTSMGAQIFEGHRLITQEPYRLVRHPMYLGIILTGMGGILLYRTWTLIWIFLTGLGLVLRARREEQALAAEFGEQWQAYCLRTPGWFPFPRPIWLAQVRSRLHPGAAALLEVGILFLPAIPAYLWLWPNVSGTAAWIAQSLAYVYILAGTLFIGLRRWSLSQLGLNRNGLELSLACGLVLLAGRLLTILSIDFATQPSQITPGGLVVDLLYYFGLVGLVEELLYRGLVYRALDEWLGVRWAIWGSSIGFVLWHIFGQGPLIGFATLLIGLFFALIRWRTGGILGLILIHGLWDLQAILLVAGSNQEVLSAGRPEIPHPAGILLGLALMLFVPIFLWKIYPLIGHGIRHHTA